MYLGFQRLLAETSLHCLNHATWLKQGKSLTDAGQQVKTDSSYFGMTRSRMLYNSGSNGGPFSKVVFKS